jgi:hypothetical protein
MKTEYLYVWSMLAVNSSESLPNGNFSEPVSLCFSSTYKEKKEVNNFSFNFSI